MRTFFALDKHRHKIRALNSCNVQWNKKLLSPGDFSIELDFSEWSTDFVYIYKDGEDYLGVIQKYSYSFNVDGIKKVQISGVFIEALLNNIPVMPFDYLRQLDSISGIVLYTPNCEKPKDYLTTLRKENLVSMFIKGLDIDTGANRAIHACRNIAQLALHEYPKFLNACGISDAIMPFDNIDTTYISEEDIEKLFDPQYYTSPADDSDVVPDAVISDSVGKVIYTIPKGSTVYLGTQLYNWLNAEKWVDPDIFPDLNINPLSPTLRCSFNIETGSITLKFSNKATVITSPELSEGNNNIKSITYNQDITSEPSAGIARSVYLRSADETPEGENRYACIEGIALRDAYSKFEELPLDPIRLGKIEVYNDYLGNTFEDYIIEKDAIQSVEESIYNFNNANITMSITLEPLFDYNSNTADYFEVGKVIKVNGYYRRIVERREIIKDGEEYLTFVLESSIKNAFKKYYNATNSSFDNGKTR